MAIQAGRGKEDRIVMRMILYIKCLVATCPVLAKTRGKKTGFPEQVFLVSITALAKKPVPPTARGTP
jgi:hypothetical protein